MGNRAVTTFSIDHMYLTEEEDERDAEECTARGSTTLGRPIIVGADRKTEWRSTRTPSEMQSQWRPLDCDKNCSRHQRVGIQGIESGPEGRPRSGHCRRTEEMVPVRPGETVPMKRSVGESQEQRQSGERSSESPGSDQKAEGRIGEEIEYESQASRSSRGWSSGQQD